MIATTYKASKIIRRTICILKGVQRYFDCGWWLPHNYKEILPMTTDKYIANVYISNHKVRMKYSGCLPPNPDEILIENVPIRRFICKSCGKEMIVFDNTYGRTFTAMPEGGKNNGI